MIWLPMVPLCPRTVVPALKVVVPLPAEEDAVVGAARRAQHDVGVARQTAVPSKLAHAGVGDVDGAVEHKATRRHAFKPEDAGHVQVAVEGDAVQEVAAVARGPKLAAAAGVDGAADGDAALQHGAARAGHDLAAGASRHVAAEHQRAAVERAQRAIVGDSRFKDGDGAAGHIGADGAVVDQHLRAADVDLAADGAAVSAHGGAGAEGGGAVAVEVEAVVDAAHSAERDAARAGQGAGALKAEHAAVGDVDGAAAEGQAVLDALQRKVAGHVHSAAQRYAFQEVAAVAEHHQRPGAGGVDAAATDGAAELIDNAAVGDIDDTAGVVDVVAGRDTQVGGAGAADVDDAGIGGAAPAHQVQAKGVDVDLPGVVEVQHRLPGVDRHHAGAAYGGRVSHAGVCAGLPLPAAQVSHLVSSFQLPLVALQVQLAAPTGVVIIAPRATKAARANAVLRVRRGVVVMQVSRV
ncbi:MAG: hypothetical protein IPI03_20385 [Rubrivivax sp.]|nr:hypothetical protein [Rubrivivax sp.]